MANIPIAKTPAEEMVDMLKKRIAQRGVDRLEEVEEEFEAARRLYAGLSFWPEVEHGSAQVLAAARQEAVLLRQQQAEISRQHEMELLRIKSQQTLVTVIQQPNATSGIDAGGVDQQNIALGALKVAHTTTTL